MVKTKRILAFIVIFAILCSNMVLALNNITVNSSSNMRTVQDILGDIAYYGDRSICKMDRQMALAYCDVISNIPNNINNLGIDLMEFGIDTDDINVILADFANDGMPVLCIMSKYDILQIWGYENSKAKNADVMLLSNTSHGSIEYYLGSINGQVVLLFYESVSVAEGHNDDKLEFYSISNGQIKNIHSAEGQWREAYGLAAYSGSVTELLQDFKRDGFLPMYDYPCLSDNNLQHDDLNCVLDDNRCTYFYKITIDGKQFKNVSFSSHDYNDISYINTYIKNQVGFTQTNQITNNSSLFINSGNQYNTIQSLNEYANAVSHPVYQTFTNVIDTIDNKRLDKIIEIVSSDYSGEIGEVFQISSDRYYVILYKNGELSNCLMVKFYLENGDLKAKIDNAEQTSYDETTLTNYRQNDLKSNISLEYTGNLEKMLDNLNNALKNVDGTQPNDAAKAEIASYIENAISKFSITNEKAFLNKFTLKQQNINDVLENALNIKSDFEKILGDLELNKELALNLMISVSSIKFDDNIVITLDNSIINTVKNFDSIQVYLGDSSHSIKFTSSNIESILNKYGQIKIGIQKTDENIYSIKFFDKNNKEIAKLVQNVAFSLPAQGETSTVFASYGEYTNNWGGQYDSKNKALSFETPYTGVYEIMDNSEKITDIADLDDETQKAIRFMVSKGYFTLDENGSFNPNASLTRYDLTASLVGMFFALDHQLETKFTDVAKDSEYYSYIASGEQKEIIEGFDDNTFRGDNAITNAELVALASRTLVHQKNYTYPENISDYLTFVDALSIPEWAKQTTAFAVRENIIKGEGNFLANEAVSRQAAAVILYRLFMLLYEPPLNTVKVPQSDMLQMILLVSGCVLAVIVVTSIFIIYKKKKRKALAVCKSEVDTNNLDKSE